MFEYFKSLKRFIMETCFLFIFWSGEDLAVAYMMRIGFLEKRLDLFQIPDLAESS
jgi:hypothetical protein